MVSYQTDAASPSFLYASWLEFSASTGVHQVRVAVYEPAGTGAGTTGTTDDRWTFLDKGGLVGLNSDSRRAARHVQWVQTTPLHHAPDASGLANFLYLLWEEDDAACGELPQIRVVVFNGNNRSPLWVAVHGELPTDVPGPAFGLLCSDKFDDVTYECQLPSTLNRRPCKAATLPTGVATAAGDLVVSWSESGGDGEFDQLRAAVFGRIDDAAATFVPSTHPDPAWTAVEGDDTNFFGLNRLGHSGYHARDASLALVKGVVTAVWTEVGVRRPNLRVAQWNAGVYPANVEIRDPDMKVVHWSPLHRYAARYIHQETYRVFVAAQPPKPPPPAAAAPAAPDDHREALTSFLATSAFTLRFGGDYLRERFQSNALCLHGSCHAEYAAALASVTSKALPVNVSAAAMEEELNALLVAARACDGCRASVRKWDHSYLAGHYEGGIEHWEVVYEWKVTISLAPGQASGGGVGSEVQRQRVLGVGVTLGGLRQEDLTCEPSVGSGFEDGPKRRNGRPALPCLLFEYTLQAGDGSSNGGESLFDYYGAGALQVPPGSRVHDAALNVPVASLSLPKASSGEDLTSDLLAAPRFFCRDPHLYPDCRVAVTVVDDTVHAHMVVASSAVPDHEVLVALEEIARGEPRANQVGAVRVPVQPIELRIPLNPTLAENVLEVPRGGVVGVAVNGVPLVSYLDIFGHNTVEGEWAEPTDSCRGFVRRRGGGGGGGGVSQAAWSGAEVLFAEDVPGDVYSYRSMPLCLGDLVTTHALLGTPSPLVGYALDGFAIYGPFDEQGQLPVDLDRCNGRVNTKGIYQYHMTWAPPYTVGCFRGSFEGFSSAKTPLAKSFPGG